MGWAPFKVGRLTWDSHGLQNCLELVRSSKEPDAEVRAVMEEEEEEGRERKTLTCSHVYTGPCILTGRQGFTPEWGKHVQGHSLLLIELPERREREREACLLKSSWRLGEDLYF